MILDTLLFMIGGFLILYYIVSTLALGPVSFSAVPSCAGAPHPVRRTVKAIAREEAAAKNFLLDFMLTAPLK